MSDNSNTATHPLFQAAEISRAESVERAERTRRGEPEPEKPLKWVRDLGWRVHGDLITKYTAIQRFREMVLRWSEQYKTVQDAHDAWQRRVREYEARVLTDARLGDRKAGPPKRGWVWFPPLEPKRPVKTPKGKAKAGKSPSHISTTAFWVPRDLLPDNQPPEAEFPLPVPKREMTREERYAILAAVHDVICNGVEKVDSFPQPPQTIDHECGTPEYEAALRSWMAMKRDRAHWDSLIGEVPRLLERDRPAFEAVYKAVEADLLNLRQSAQPTRHSPDFRSVHWFRTDYTFTKTQAIVVGLLWQTWEGGTPDVGEETLLEEVDAKSSRLVDIFRDNPAWGTMIVTGATKGTRRLALRPDS